jgi:biotin synthase-related radical SAM superfamily protein
MILGMSSRRFLANLTAIAAYLMAHHARYRRGCSTRTVQRLMQMPGCPILSMGSNKVVVTADRLDAWLAEREEAA